jgi:non-heme chloroperoxidase
VVLLHGGGQTRHAWGGTTQVLATQGFLALALDLRGHGESDWAPDGDYGIDAHAADLRAVVAAFGRPALLVGASLGGLAALIAAGEAPRLEAPAIVLVDVTPRIDPAGASASWSSCAAIPGARLGRGGRRGVGLPAAPAAPSDVSLARTCAATPTAVTAGTGPRVHAAGRLGGHHEPRRLRTPRARSRAHALVRGGKSEIVSEGVAAFRR